MTIKSKIKTREELVELKKSSNKVFGYTSGTFDILHSGHAKYLEEAKKFCDFLVVGVNSDSSVRSYKGSSRPIISQGSRVELLAALASVDYVFIFNEVNNNENIKLLEPDVYIKAGDYSEDQLSSAPIVKSYGGRIKIIAFESGYSSSSIIERSAISYGVQDVFTGVSQKKEHKPTVFIDRDGTINEEVPYLHEAEKFKLIEGAAEALLDLTKAGFRIVIVTNQPGIGMGYFTKEDFYKVNLEMLKNLGPKGVLIDKIYMCPHSKAENCSCRKPKAFFIEQACREMSVDLENSYVIGDMTSDVMFAKNAACKSILVGTGKAGSDNLYDVKPDIFADNILDGVRKILT